MSRPLFRVRSGPGLCDPGLIPSPEPGLCDPGLIPSPEPGLCDPGLIPSPEPGLCDPGPPWGKQHATGTAIEIDRIGMAELASMREKHPARPPSGRNGPRWRALSRSRARCWRPSRSPARTCKNRSEDVGNRARSLLPETQCPCLAGGLQMRREPCRKERGSGVGSGGDRGVTGMRLAIWNPPDPWETN
jgi:hypothetical protein